MSDRRIMGDSSNPSWHQQAARITSLEAALKQAVEALETARTNSREFCSGVLDRKYFGAVERSDARLIREIAQAADAAIAAARQALARGGA